MSQENEKRQFIAKFETIHSELQERAQALQKEIPAVQQKNLDEKSSRLTDKISELKWRIENFERSQTSLDQTVRNSFEELKDEIEWRITEVQAGLEGKELWESEDVAKRGKGLFKGGSA